MGWLNQLFILQCTVRKQLVAFIRTDVKTDLYLQYARPQHTRLLHQTGRSLNIGNNNV